MIDQPLVPPPTIHAPVSRRSLDSQLTGAPEYESLRVPYVPAPVPAPAELPSTTISSPESSNEPDTRIRLINRRQ
eukprot:1231966-Pleurochrysis_carterae.AAC.1